MDHFSDLDHLRFLHTPCGDRRCPDTYTGRHERLLRIEGNGVFVDGHSSAIKCLLYRLAGNAGPDERNQHEVRVGATGDNVVATQLEALRHCLGVGHDLLLIRFEFGLKRFLEGHRLRSNHMH